ncbi:hypothetical protein DRO38_08435, partial [Candidatus Bathyarchaeota archaeon]
LLVSSNKENNLNKIANKLRCISLFNSKNFPFRSDACPFFRVIDKSKKQKLLIRAVNVKFCL